MKSVSPPDEFDAVERKRNRLHKFLRWVAALGLLFWLCVYGFQVLKATSEAAKATVCASNLRQLAFASLEYAADHNDRFPPAQRWSVSLTLGPPAEKRTSDWRCVGVPDDESGYAMASKLSSVFVADLPDPALEPLLFDSTLPGWNAHGDLSSLPEPGRHGSHIVFGGSGRYNWIAYADGHVEQTPKRRKP